MNIATARERLFEFYKLPINEQAHTIWLPTQLVEATDYEIERAWQRLQEAGIQYPDGERLAISILATRIRNKP